MFAKSQEFIQVEVNGEERSKTPPVGEGVRYNHLGDQKDKE